MIACLYSFNNGSIEVDNLKINTNYKINLWQKKIGYVSQATFLKEGTVRSNIAFGIEDNEIDNEKVLKSMESAELGNFLSKINYDLNSCCQHEFIRDTIDSGIDSCYNIEYCVNCEFLKE